MSNVISFCDFRQRKLEEQEEREWNLLDNIFANSFGETGTITLTLSDENGTILWTSDGEDDDNPK